MGAGMILLGLCFISGWSFVTIKLILILFFMWVTGTTATHALAKAAVLNGLEPWTASDSGAKPGGAGQ